MPDQHPQFVLDILPSTDLSQDAFVTGAANKAAFDAVMSWPKWQSPGVVLVGPPGSGKTHLGSIWVERTGGRMMQLEMLSTRHIENGLTKPVCFDAGAQANIRHEDALFHVLNFAKEESVPLLFLAQSAPAHWKVKLPDLVSRLKTLSVIEIALPDDDLLTKVMAKNFADMGLNPSKPVMSFLLTRMERSYAGAAMIARLIGERTLAEKRRLTVRFASEMLDMLAAEA